MKDNNSAADPIGSAVAASRRPRMTQHEIAWLLACSARIQQVYLAARGRLDASLFEPNEAQFVLVWRAINAAADDNKGLVPTDPKVAKEIIALKCSVEMAVDPNRLFYTPLVEESVMGEGGLLDDMFALPVSDEVENQAITILGKFVRERMLSDPLRRALSGLTVKDTIDDPGELMTLIERHNRELAGIDTDPANDAVIPDPNFIPPDPRIYTTASKWLDELIGGGQAPQECYAVLGPTSGGKSSLGVQIAVDGAALQAAMAADVGPDQAGWWYFFTYELTEDQLRSRVYAYGARIHAEVLQKRLKFSTSEDPTTLRDYEHDPIVNSPGNPLQGERERISGLVKRMSGVNSRLKIVDYSGTKPGQGNGGIEEVAAYLKREQARGKRTTGVVIDYAGLAVRRYVAAKRLRPESEYPLLSSFMDNVRNLISIPLDTTTWVLHQLRGDAAKRAPGAITHHSEAQGCSSFANNADFGIQLTNYNKVTNLLTVFCTKTRRAKALEDGRIVKFDTRFGMFMEPESEYVFDVSTRKYVPKGYVNDFTQDGIPTNRPRTHSTPLVDPRDGMD